MPILISRSKRTRIGSFRMCAALMVTAIVMIGCGREESSSSTSSGVDGTQQSRQRVVIYCSVDEEYAEKILAAFAAEHPEIEVLPRYDTETTKTTGLVERLRSERANPQADVFWSSEVFLTIRLAEEGLLRPNESAAPADWPREWRDEQRRWYGMAARARVIAYATDRGIEPPTTWEGIADAKYKGRVVMADPALGTTRGHVAAMWTVWGLEKCEAFFRALVSNEVRIVASNSQAVREVVNGSADLAMTDSDDVWTAQRNGYKVAAVYPRHGDGEGMGTLLIPNTVSLIAGRPESAAVEALVEFLLSERVEQMLYESDSHNVPVGPGAGLMALEAKYVVSDPLVVDYGGVAAKMDEAMGAADRILRRRDR